MAAWSCAVHGLGRLSAGPDNVHFTHEDIQPQREVKELVQSHTATKPVLSKDSNHINQHSDIECSAAQPNAKPPLLIFLL